MRPLERYWLKVSITVGVVAIVVLVLLMAGMSKELSHLYDSIEKILSS